MIIIKTYIKDDNDNFILVQNFNQTVKDSTYMNGAIELTINNVNLITINMWDYIVTLWAYLIQGLHKIYRNKGHPSHKLYSLKKINEK